LISVLHLPRLVEEHTMARVFLFYSNTHPLIEYYDLEFRG